MDLMDNFRWFLFIHEIQPYLDYFSIMGFKSNDLQFVYGLQLFGDYFFVSHIWDDGSRFHILQAIETTKQIYTDKSYNVGPPNDSSVGEQN